MSASLLVRFPRAVPAARRCAFQRTGRCVLPAGQLLLVAAAQCQCRCPVHGELNDPWANEVGGRFVFDGMHWVPFEAVLVPPDHLSRHL